MKIIRDHKDKGGAREADIRECKVTTSKIKDILLQGVLSSEILWVKRGVKDGKRTKGFYFFYPGPLWINVEKFLAKHEGHSADGYIVQEPEPSQPPPPSPPPPEPEYKPEPFEDILARKVKEREAIEAAAEADRLYMEMEMEDEDDL